MFRVTASAYAVSAPIIIIRKRMDAFSSWHLGVNSSGNQTAKRTKFGERFRDDSQTRADTAKREAALYRRTVAVPCRLPARTREDGSTLKQAVSFARVAKVPSRSS